MNNLTGRLEKEIAFYAQYEKKLQSYPPIINEYYIFMRANRRSYMSINIYISNVMHFVNFLHQENVPNEFYTSVRTTDIERYFISLETKANGQRTGDDILQQRWSSLNGFFQFLQKRKYINENPVAAIERPKNNTEHKVTYLTKAEIAKLFKAIEKNPNKFNSERDKAIVSLALSTGLRVSALINLNVEDIDFNNHVIRVIEKRQKVRDISIGGNTEQILAHWIEVRNNTFANLDTNALFITIYSQRITRDAVGDMLERYCKEACIKRITPHKLRATAACMLAKAGLPVKAIAKQLGHNNTQVTMRYIDVFAEDEEKVLNILDGLV
jgi:integrase/recombinase XerC